MSEEGKIEKIRRLAREGRIQFAANTRIKEAGGRVRLVLDAIGVKSAFVSDESTVGDFSFFWEGREETEALQEIAEELGLDKVEPTDYIWSVANRLPSED